MTLSNVLRTYKGMLVFLLVISFSLGCQGQKASPDTLAKVGDRKISLSDFKRKLSEYSGDGPVEKVDLPIRKQILNDLIERELLLLEADRRNIAIAKTELENEMIKVIDDYPGQEFEKMLLKQKMTVESWRKNLEETLLVKKVFDRITSTPLSLDEDQLKVYYQEHLDEFKEPERVRALHILVDSEKEAFEALAAIRKQTPFETVAREKSKGPEANKGGDLGEFPRGVMPTIFDETIFALKVGKVSRVVSSEYGFHIFKLVERNKERTIPFDECRDVIINRLTEEHRQHLYNQWLEASLKQTRVLKNYELLAKLE